MRPGEVIPDARLAHRVGLSHLGYRTTEENIKEFFDPLKLVQVDIMYKDGHPLGKANAYFRSHADAVQAMEMDQTSLRRYNVNLYLDSKDPENNTQPQETKTDSSQLESSGSEVKKYKWDQMLVDLLLNTVEHRLSVDRLLERCVYTIRQSCGSDRNLVKGQLQDKFLYHLKNHNNIKVVDGEAVLIHKPEMRDKKVETPEKASEETSPQPQSTVKKKFKWKRCIREILETSSGEMSVSKLQKLLMLAYVEEEAGLSKEELKTLCMEKINSATVIDKDVVRLKQ